MWYSIAQSGFASVGIDFTDGLSLLIVSLVWLVWLSAGLITVLAVQYLWSPLQTQMQLAEAISDAVDHRRWRNETALPLHPCTEHKD